MSCSYAKNPRTLHVEQCASCVQKLELPEGISVMQAEEVAHVLTPLIPVVPIQNCEVSPEIVVDAHSFVPIEYNVPV